MVSTPIFRGKNGLHFFFWNKIFFYTRKWVNFFLFLFLFCEIVENELLNPHIFQHVVGKTRPNELPKKILMSTRLVQYFALNTRIGVKQKYFL